MDVPEFIICETKTQEYAAICLRLFEVAHEALSELDEIIRAWYNVSDDANYFYVRRRLKFIENFEKINSIESLESEIRTLALYGVVFEDSQLHKVLAGVQNECDALAYYLYTDVLKDFVNASLILLKEMQGMPLYVGLDTLILEQKEKVETLLADIKTYCKRMGYSILDVELFEQIPETEEIECVEINDVHIGHLDSGDVYEIVKIGVNFGSCKEKTEVKIKK